jgi:hypothetical protein
MYLRTLKKIRLADGTFRHPHWQMDTNEILPFFNLEPGHPIPKDLECSTIIMDGDGDPNVMYMLKARSGKHRVHVECPKCRKLIPAGRIRQHAKVHRSASCPQY